jgi:ADP-ribose pyrophosphatase YjhB (NUDIX family)
VKVERKGRRQVFANSRFTVYSDCIADGTTEVPDFMVVEPHTARADFLTGVAIVPLREGRILLLRHWRHVVSEPVWELPRGFVDRGEEPTAAALRELAEETGLVCAREKLVDLGTFLPDPGILRARVAVVAATECEPGNGRLDDEIGIEDRVWFPEEEVRRMLRDGTLQEGASCVALYRYFESSAAGRIA